MKTKAEALRKGKILLKRVRLKTKRLDVFENLGWHAAVRSDAISSIFVPDYGFHTYHALTNPAYAFWTDSKHFTDPNKAIRHAVKNARKYVNEMNAMVKKMEADLL